MHENLYEDVQGYMSHKIFKMNWRDKILELFLDFPWSKIFRIIGIYIIYMTLIKHFNVTLIKPDFDMGEAILIGVCIGLVA